MCACVRVCVCVRECECVCAFVCRNLRAGLHACVFASVSVCLCVGLLGRMCACVNVPVCVYSYV